MSATESNRTLSQIFFHENLPYELPTIIRIPLTIFCGRKNRDFDKNYRQKDRAAILFFCESNIEDQGNELLKMSRLISQYFHQAWLEVTGIAKNNGNRSIVIENIFTNTVLYNLF